MREISYNKDYVKLDGGFYFAQGVFETCIKEFNIKRLQKD